MKQSVKDIRQLTKQELTDAFVAMGDAPFRAKQVYEWLWKKSARSFDEMTNLTKELRQKLAEQFSFQTSVIEVEQKSEDGTVKLGLRLYDGELVEAVLIPTENRMTACVSSQVGCSLSCKFCATGFLDRKRNLEAAEIYDQVVDVQWLAQKYFEKPLTNIVFMGMGEPLLNYKNVLMAIDHITSPEGLHMSPKRITVSTAGIAKIIKKLADDQVRFNLALSLHAADDEKRNRIMPINEQNNLEALVDALNYFHLNTKNTITFEYILFDKFNDTPDDAKKLVKLCKRIPAKVNLIEYNRVDGVPFIKSAEGSTDSFIDYLESQRITVKLRKSRGKDIDAACGQLANKQ